jgi:hypothetical protein
MAMAAPGGARNIDLSTVPDRDTVQLTIYNSEDLTLVRETRKVSFKPGENPLQFSWANTLIDPTSVELRFLTDPDKLDVLDTTFPHDKPQMLYWNVQSEIDGEAVIEITYFTSGISWSADYVCIADSAETQMDVESFVRVQNNSGEQYEQAQVRLVVGQINLVEKIAELARVPMSKVAEMDDKKRREWKLNAIRRLALPGPAGRPSADSAPAPDPQATPKEIIKEGLSEYFIYTIEGTETIANGWSKRLRSFEAEDVPFKIEYRYREPEYGPRLVRLYLLRNDEESGLGTTPLPDGIFRVFRDNGRGGLSFLVAQHRKYVPIGDKVELNLGPDPDVIFELIEDQVWRDNIWMHVHGTSVYRRVDDGRLKVEVNSSVAGWDEHTVYHQRIRNYTGKPIAVEVRRSFSGHVEFRSRLKAKNHDYRTVEYRTTVPAGKSAALAYEIVRHEGRNKKQENVTVVRRHAGK